jgi:peptidase E
MPLLGVAELALRMQRFFGDKTALLAQIQKGAPLLGMSAAANVEGPV